MVFIPTSNTRKGHLLHVFTSSFEFQLLWQVIIIPRSAFIGDGILNSRHCLSDLWKRHPISSCLRLFFWKSCVSHALLALMPFLPLSASELPLPVGPGASGVRGRASHGFVPLGSWRSLELQFDVRQVGPFSALVASALPLLRFSSRPQAVDAGTSRWFHFFCFSHSFLCFHHSFPVLQPRDFVPALHSFLLSFPNSFSSGVTCPSSS